jgi:hypothetical protein
VNRALRRISLVLFAIAAAGGPAAAQPSLHLRSLDYHALMSTWTCHGSDDRGAALTAKAEWGFNDGGAFYFNLVPAPATRVHPRISETWEWDAASKTWRAVPDAGTAEAVQFESDGWHGATLTWIRMAANSTQDRTFVRTTPNRLTFRSERALPTAGAGRVRHHVFYALDCRRTVDDSPR